MDDQLMEDEELMKRLERLAALEGKREGLNMRASGWRPGWYRDHKREVRMAERKIYLETRDKMICRLYYKVFERHVSKQQTGHTLMLSQQLAWLAAVELVDDIIGVYEGGEQ